MKRRSKHILPFEILYEDDNVIVIDKPAGMLSTHTHLGTRLLRETQVTAENILNGYVRKGQRRSNRRVWLVHRLDRDTGGVMMFAKSREVADYFRSDWNALTEKTYHARVDGVVGEDSGVYESNLLEDADGYRVRSVTSGGKKAVTEWKVLSRSGNATLVEVNLKSGRKNQIRVHFSEHGHPVSGDTKYGSQTCGPLRLRSVKLRFKPPDGLPVEVETDGLLKAPHGRRSASGDAQGGDCIAKHQRKGK